MTAQTKAEMEAFANECIKGEPTRVPSRRERELGHMVLSLLAAPACAAPVAMLSIGKYRMDVNAIIGDALKALPFGDHMLFAAPPDFQAGLEMALKRIEPFERQANEEGEGVAVTYLRAAMAQVRAARKEG